MTPRELVDEQGSPLWLVDLDRVRRRVREFRATWERRFEEVDVAYSYKTNRLPAILLAVADEGAAPEVVSYAEYVLAREVVGARGESIVVNGPAKPDRLLQRAAEDDALVIVDGADDDEAQELLGLVPLQVGQDVLVDQLLFARGAH